MASRQPPGPQTLSVTERPYPIQAEHTQILAKRHQSGGKRIPQEFFRLSKPITAAWENDFNHRRAQTRTKRRPDRDGWWIPDDGQRQAKSHRTPLPFLEASLGSLVRGNETEMVLGSSSPDIHLMNRHAGGR